MSMHQKLPPETLAYSLAEAALATGRSRTRLKRAIRERELTALVDGARVIIMRAELLRWLGTFQKIGRMDEGAPDHAA